MNYKHFIFIIISSVTTLTACFIPVMEKNMFISDSSENVDLCKSPCKMF